MRSKKIFKNMLRFEGFGVDFWSIWGPKLEPGGFTEKSHQPSGGLGVSLSHQHIIHQPTIPNPLIIKYYILSYNKTGLEEWFTPPPTSSPGSQIVRPRPVVGAHIRLVRHLGRHRFFIIFPTPGGVYFVSAFQRGAAAPRTPRKAGPHWAL